MKKAAVFSLLLYPFICGLTADEYRPNPNRLDYLEASVKDLNKQVAELKEQSKQRGTNPPASPVLNSTCDAFVTGDLLYWKANENGLGYVLQSKIENAALDLPGNGELITPNFDWDLGFRVGLGWRTNHDNWDLYFTWTRIHTAAHSHRHSNSNKSLFPVFADNTFASSSCDSASAHLHIHLNALDLEMGRNFFVGKHLSLRPHVGFENLWLSQHYNTHYSGLPAQSDAFNEVRFRNNYWGFGIRSGIDSQWDIRWGISIFSDIAFALLYGDFDLKRTTKYNLDFLSNELHKSSHIDEGFWLARANVEFNIGLRWDWTFAHDRFFLRLQAGWEEHLYFGQNQMFNFFDTDQVARGKSVSSNDDVAFQGLMASVRLDF